MVAAAEYRRNSRNNRFCFSGGGLHASPKVWTGDSMKRFQRFQFAAAGLAALGLVLPSGRHVGGRRLGHRPADRDSTRPAGKRGAVPAGAMPPGQAPTVLDVSLGDGGMLSGQVVDAQGRPMAQTPVVVRGASGQVAVAGTDGGGRFQFRGLPGGLYEVTAAEAQWHVSPVGQ